MGTPATGMRTAGILLAVVLLLSWVASATRERVDRNEAAQLLKGLTTVLPADSFDNEPGQDRILVTEPGRLGSEAPLPVYRARRGGVPVAAVVTVVARQGYVGPIRLLVALDPQGTVLGVRALAHQETPGVGDRIDADKSDWLSVFRGRSLQDPDPAGWAARRDGGQFDQLTGATITSRAVISATRDAALYFREHRAEIFDRPPE